MDMVGIFPLILVLMLSNGTGNELLDYVHTPSYWQIQGVEINTKNMLAQLQQEKKTVDTSSLPGLIQQLGAKEFEKREQAMQQIAALGRAAEPQLREATKSGDPEIAERSAQLLNQLPQEKVENESVRRLMAIRTLGDLKAADAVPVLEKLLNSEKLFEATYAQRALAAIRGEKVPASKLDQTALNDDLALLPANTGMVVQAKVAGHKRFDFEKALEQLAPMAAQMGADPQQVLLQATGELLKLVNLTGNIRLESGTGGLTRVVVDNTGAFTLALRGRYDKERIERLLVKSGANAVEHGNHKLYHVENELALIPVSDERLVLFTGANSGEFPVEHVTAALQSEKSELALQDDLKKVMEGCDRTAPLWLAALVTDSYQQMEPLRAFRSITVDTVRVEKGMKLKAEAQGDDPERVKQQVAEMNADLARTIAQVEQMAQQMPRHMTQMDPMWRFMKSIKLSAEGTKAHATATFSGDATSAVLMPLMMVFNAKLHGAAQHGAPVQRQVEPQKVAPAVEHAH